jgi:hypothetical protein
MKTCCYLLLLLYAAGVAAQPRTDTLQTTLLQPAALRADFDCLRRLLEETHPGLYRYTPRVAMQARLDSVAATLHQPLPFYAFYRTVAALLAGIRCAHTHAMPTPDWQQQYTGIWKTLPLFMYPAGGRSYVVFNGTFDRTVQPGFELLEINGQSMDEIRRTLPGYHWDDGYIPTSAQAPLRLQLFSLFYYWFMGQPDRYQLSFRDLKGDTLRVDVPAQTFAQSVPVLKKNPVNRQMLAWYDRKMPKSPWRLSFPGDVPGTALLRLDNFGGKGVHDAGAATARFRGFMDKCLAKMERQQTRHLVLDLRDNAGGWDIQGVELLTYLLKGDSAVRYYDRRHTVTDSSSFLRFSDVPPAILGNLRHHLTAEVDGTFTEKEDDDSRELGPQLPKPNRFRGLVYILMNGYSGSATAEFLAVAHANRVGVFVGEESGGAYEGGNGGNFITLTLPHSGIEVSTPLVHYHNAVGTPPRPGRGTPPDHEVPLSIEDILQHRDGPLEYVKKLIRDQYP